MISPRGSRREQYSFRLFSDVIFSSDHFLTKQQGLTLVQSTGRLEMRLDEFLINFQEIRRAFRIFEKKKGLGRTNATQTVQFVTLI